MLIDRTHRGWAIASSLLLLAAAAVYLVYARTWPGGPSARSWPGMLFGVAGTALMVFAGLLAVRKKCLRPQIGDLVWWLKGHIWLGMLSLPLILFHAAFRVGGTLEALLWIILGVVIASGVIGVILQNLLPKLMRLELPDEVIPDQAEVVFARLTELADARITESCGAAALEEALRRPPDFSPSLRDHPKGWLAGYYLDAVRPYLSGRQTTGSSLANAEEAKLAFANLRSALPYDLQSAVDSLEDACDRHRQIARQLQLYHLLHGWLKVHVPASIILYALAVVHVVTALYY